MKSDWAKLLDETLAEAGDKIEPGYLTYQQIAALWNRSEGHTRSLLASLVAANKIDTRSFRVMTRSGLRSTPHYRLKAAASAKRAA